VLTPFLRPLFRWNHAWAIAQEGLEPYARAASEASLDGSTGFSEAVHRAA
jgi:hypothetical protein